jgi:hypothetical protein
MRPGRRGTPGILNQYFLFKGLRVATIAVDLSALGNAGSNAVVLLLLDTQHYGILVAQIFFGLWLVPCRLQLSATEPSSCTVV